MRKTLIWNGSPRVAGDTAAMIGMLTAQLTGQWEVVDCYRARIAPCVDCRYCRTHSGCAIEDEMQAVYRAIAESDNVVIASPIYFSQPTGRLLEVGSRLQTYFSGRFFRKEPAPLAPKRGAVLLAGGGSLNPDRAYETARLLLGEMQAKEVYPLICSHDTDRIPAAEDSAVREQIRHLAAFLNQENG